MKSISLWIVVFLFCTSVYGSSWTMNIINNYNEVLYFMEEEIPKNAIKTYTNYKTPNGGITHIKVMGGRVLAVIYDQGHPAWPHDEPIYVWDVNNHINQKEFHTCYSTSSRTVNFSYDLIVDVDGRVSMTNCKDDLLETDCTEVDNSRCGH